MSSSTPEPKRGFVIAIDGPAGAGKSTLASSLARELGLPYINTGLMYRAVAASALERGLDPDDVAALSRVAEELRFSLESGSLRIDGGPKAEELTSPEVESIVSKVARHSEVRSVLRAAQRQLGAEGAVIEGRDIGTVVFPDADVKVFLRAERGERAARRQSERGSRDPSLAEALQRRDALDSLTNPLVPAPDAHLIDTSGKDPTDVLAEVMELAGSVGGDSPGGDGGG